MVAVGKRWWIGGLVATWAVLLVVAASWSAHHDPATVRGQTDLASGRQTLDRAVATLVDVAGPGAAPRIEPYVETTGCRISMSRQGTELDQTVVLSVPAGQEPQLLDRMAAELPAEWGSSVSAQGDRFRADAGNFVSIRGGFAEPGLVRLTAGTGCRPQ